LETTFRSKLGSERLPPLVETALYRVAQEALGNIRKHASAQQVQVALERSDQQVRLTVTDDGCGFDPSALAQSARGGEKVGLAGMRERLTFVGGSCRIESRPARGTRVLAEISLSPGPR
jgi:signal transduction histidine kinase